MVVGKSREGIPTWDGDPSTWTTYRRSALLFVESTKWENRYLCGPRLASELTGPAKASIASKKPTWLSHEHGVTRLLKHLEEAISEPILPEVGNALRSYFRTLRRKRGETMTSFCVRHREEYEKACRALTRMMGSQKHGLGRDQGSRTSSRWSCWDMHHNTSGLGRQSGGAEGSGREGDDVAASEGAEEPWMAWYRTPPAMQEAKAGLGTMGTGTTGGMNAAGSKRQTRKTRRRPLKFCPM